MSSSDSPVGGQFSTEPVVTDDQLTTETEHPSVATFKSVIDYGLADSIRSVVPVAKYIAIKHPGFIIAPALPSVYNVEFETRDLVKVDHEVEQRTTLTVFYGEKPVQQKLGTITISRRYDGMPDMSRRLDGVRASNTTVEYSEATTP